MVLARAGEEKRGSWSEEQIRMGFKDFDAMCITCHPAPGKERSDISKGLRPEPPDLAKASKQWTNAQLLWIVKNGVNMTGMPAFGRTHDDERIWGIVGFISKLQGMSAQDFHSVELELEASAAHQSHSH